MPSSDTKYVSFNLITITAVIVNNYLPTWRPNSGGYLPSCFSQEKNDGKIEHTTQEIVE